MNSATNYVDIDYNFSLEEEIKRILSQENVKVNSTDYVHVANQMISIIKDGPEKLQVIMDFDQTMSKYMDDKGNKCVNTFSILNKALSQNFRNACAENDEKYNKIVLDETLSPEEKYPILVQGYKKSLEDIKLENLVENDIKLIVQKYGPQLRNKLKETLELLNKMEIPVLVFSAGFGNIIEQILLQAGLLFKNVKIVSNYFEFDSITKKLLNLKEPIIHKFNKDLTTFENEHSNYFTDLIHRPNIILVGDQIPDTQMSNGRQTHGKLLNIGFLNTDVDTKLASFLQKFDLAIVQDESFTVIYQILKHIERCT